MLGMKEYFSSALQYIFSKAGKERYGAPTQQHVAGQLRVAPSTLSDYTRGRREGDEQSRREIAYELGWNYEDLLSLGMLIAEDYNPDDWELDTDRAVPDLVGRGFRLWVSRNPEEEDRKDCLVVPPIFMRNEQIHKIVATQSGQDGKLDFGFISKFPTYLKEPFKWGKTEPSTYVPFSNMWLEHWGEIKSLAVFRITDAAMAPELPERYGFGYFLVRRFMPEENERIIDGRIYAIHNLKTNSIQPRRLSVQDENHVLVYANDANRIPPVTLNLNDLVVIGQVIYTGHAVQ